MQRDDDGRAGPRRTAQARHGALVAAMIAGMLSAPGACAAQAEDAAPFFDIPAEPLAAALDAFSAASGYQVLTADFGSAAPRSTAVKGMLAPEEALARLIAGTGLAAQFTGSKAVILIPEAHRSPALLAALPPPPAAPRMTYDGALQASVIGALCANAATSPGRYRAALDLWIAPDGAVDRAELLSSTGDPARDQYIVALLRGAAFASPPANLPQPTTVLILPQAQGADCPPQAAAQAGP